MSLVTLLNFTTSSTSVSFTPFDQAPRPPHSNAQDWIAYSGNVLVEALPISSVFTPFDRPQAPKNVIRDWPSAAFPAPVVVEYAFAPFDIPPKLPKSAGDWVAFSGNLTVEAPSTIYPQFSPFDPAPRPKNFALDSISYANTAFLIPTPVSDASFTPFSASQRVQSLARDWIAYSGNVPTTPTTITDASFTPFDQARTLPSAARDWIAFAITSATTPAIITDSLFTPFDPGRRLQARAGDWTAYSPQVFAAVQAQTELAFTPFSLGYAARLATQPQWWSYEIRAPLSRKKRDTHDGGHLRRRTPFYDDAYYEELQRKLREQIEEIRGEQPPEFQKTTAAPGRAGTAGHPADARADRRGRQGHSRHAACGYRARTAGLGTPAGGL